MFTNPIAERYASSGKAPRKSGDIMAEKNEERKQISPRPEDLPKLPSRVLSKRLRKESWNKSQVTRSGEMPIRPAKAVKLASNRARPWNYLPDNDVAVITRKPGFAMKPQLPPNFQNLGKFGHGRNGVGRRGRHIKDPAKPSAQAWKEQESVQDPGRIDNLQDESSDDFTTDLINPGVMANNSSLGNLLEVEGDEEEKQPEHVGFKNTRAPLNMTKRGELLQKAKVFKTFMEIMEEHPLFDLPYGDSFLYLSSQSGSSYDLDIISHDEIDPNDYYTLSYMGITHFIGSNSDFTPLDQFEREHYLFSMISEIHFFNKYWEWKMFSVWRRNIRAKKMKSATFNLKQRLFTLHPILGPSLIAVKSVILRMHKGRLYKISKGTTYTLDDFCDEQAAQANVCEKLLNEMNSDIAEITFQACDKTLKHFLIDNNFHKEDEDGDDGRKDYFAADTSSVIVDGDDEGQKSDGRFVSYTERAAMRTQCRRLVKFIRLVDFHTFQKHLQLATVSIATFLRHLSLFDDESDENFDEIQFDMLDALDELQEEDKEIENERQLSGEEETSPDLENEIRDDQNNESQSKGRVPLFMVEMDYDGDHGGVLKFMPHSEMFKTRVESVLFDGLKVVNSPLRLLQHDDFKLFVQPTIDEFGKFGDGSDVEMMLLEEYKFTSMLDGIGERMASAFENAEVGAQQLRPFLTIYLQNMATLEGLSMENYENNSHAEFRQLLDTHQEHKEVFETIPTSKGVGFVLINIEDLRRALMPSPQKCLDAIATLLPQIASKKNTTLLAYINECHEIVAHSPYNTDEFVRLAKFLATFEKKQDELDNDFYFLTEFYRILNEYNVHVSDDEHNAHVMLVQSMSALKDALSYSEEADKERRDRFSKELTRDIPKLKKEVEATKELLQDERIGNPEAQNTEVSDFLDTIHIKADEIEALSIKYLDHQNVLGLAATTWDDIEELKEDLTIKTKLWTTKVQWRQSSTTWVTAAYDAIDIEEVMKQMNSYRKTCQQCEYSLPDNLVVPLLKQEVNDFYLTIPVIGNIRNPALRERHWTEIHETIGFEILNSEQELTLGELMDRDIKKYAVEIDEISSTATNETSLESMLDKLVKVWKKLEFEVIPYKNKKNVYILGSVDDIITQLDDSLVTISTLLGSRFVKPIQVQVEDWQGKLKKFQETLNAWIELQRSWAYLENIFSGPDIAKQLKAEDHLFQIVDKFYRELMRSCFTLPNCIEVGTRLGLREKMLDHSKTLDKVHVKLEEFLEKKRRRFPRFFFLSNDELLEVLGQAKDPRAIQPHMTKCFDAIKSLEFGDQTSGAIDIYAMVSPKGERVGLGKNLKARGPVEDWLKEVEESMHKSLTELMKEGIQSYGEYEREEWITKCKGQVVAVVTQIMWSRGCEKALRATNVPTAMQAWLNVNIKQLSTLTMLVRGKLSKLQRRIIVALCTVDVHARDIVKELLDSEVHSTEDFKWQQQLRSYWIDETKLLEIRQSTSNIPYGYEYMGCTSRLVITPLTDRCWMTITGALHLKLGASPAGPAGTGKTESSKDLAKALGIVCIVFNCSDQIDCKQTSKLFRGLAQQGAWTCLDEFNRIDIEVLSVVAQQLLILRQGRLSGRGVVNFEGAQEMPVKEMHVIITMNPGYAGRTPLPDNLKVLFRPVAMMVPDYALIAEIMLFAEGFDGATKLSKKLWDSYKLSSEQLSQQRHYDYGLRAVKSVLVMAGSSKRANPTMSEEAVLIKAMRDSNLPKFLAADLPLYRAILRDLFPGVDAPENKNAELEHEVVKQTEAFSMQPVPGFIKKVVQVFEMFNVRFGACIVGPAGAGKSSIVNVLKTSLSALFEDGMVHDSVKKIETYVMNPKAITMGELYGEYNMLSQEWTDGLGSGIMRNCIRLANDTQDIIRWTIFDGPIDAVWIENMNTVLDDNCMLCLANGERIKLNWTMRMLFEVQDLDEASPATVSRLGVIYVPTTAVSWQPLVTSWLQRVFPRDEGNGSDAHYEIREILEQRCSTLIQPCLDFRKKACKEPVVTSEFMAVSSLLSLMESMLLWDGGEQFNGTHCAINWTAMTIENQRKTADKLFSFALLWSIGGTVSSEDMEKFDIFLSELYEKYQCEDSLPGLGRSSVWDVYFDGHATGNDVFKKWKDVVKSFNYEPKLPYFDLIVQTVDTTRYTFLMESLIRNKNPVFFTGVTGTGKTAIATSLYEKLNHAAIDEKDFTSACIILNFSAQTSSLVTQTTIESSLERKRKDLLGPPRGNNIMTVFVDDVNMPEVEEYGAQAPIELMRQLIDSKGFYERDDWLWRNIENTVVCASAAPPGGGRSVLTPRFVRHFNVFCIPNASHEVMKSIFSAIVGGFMQSKAFSADVTLLEDGLVDATIDLYIRICQELLPTPAKIHYQFNLRDVSKVFQGILMVGPKECTESITAARLWLHETSRVFSDRLINEVDRKWFRETSVEILRKYMGGAAPKEGWQIDQLFGTEPVIFGHYMRPGAATIKYEEADNLKKVGKIFNDYLGEYNDPSNKNTEMNLVFFKDAIEHISRVARILRQPRGNAMLIGQGGSGKQSLTKLGCVVSGAEFTQIELTQSFGITEFREAIKIMMEKAGVKRQSIAFTLTDAQIVDETFLEDISSVLNSGEIPNLWASDEWEKIVVSMGPVCKDLGVDQTRKNCIKYFTSLVRENLHVILCMSPVGDTLRKRCLQFPSLINCCTIDWYTKWPEEGLQTVAQTYYQQLDLPEDVYHKLVEASVQVHKSVDEMAGKFYVDTRRNVYITPCSYLDLLQLYKSLLEEKDLQIRSRIDTLTIGCTKLDETNETVAQLQVDLKELQPVLKQKSIEAEELLKVVAVEKADAEELRLKVEADERVVKAQADEVKAIADDAQKDLDKALPALAGAVKALNALDKKDIQEIKSFTNPPKQVAFVMEAVCLLLGQKTTWDVAKKVLGMMDFLAQLQNYDKDNIDPKILKKIAKYVIHEDMQVEKVAKISTAAKSLCMWVHAMHTYSIVAKEVAPKKARLEEMNKKLAEANATLAEKKAASDEVARKVQALQEQCDKTAAEKKQLEEDTKLTRDRLLRATKLTSGLAEEQVRWEEDKLDLVRRVPNMYGDMFLSAASIAYLGPFTGMYRDRMVGSWVEVVEKLQIPNSGSDDQNEKKIEKNTERDNDEKGKVLTKQVLQQLIDRAGSRGGKASVKMAFQDLDVNGDGQIEPDEFKEGLMRLEVPLNESELQRVFKYIDVDGSGTLELEEFEAVLAEHKATFSLSNILGDPVRILDWQINGLPTDSVSTENAIKVMRSKRWPLLIDPQGQANKWVRNIESKFKIICVKDNDVKLSRKVENALRLGQPLLVEDIGESLKPAIGPVLVKPDWSRTRKAPLVRLGDQEIEYHKDFRLYLTTKLPNPHYTPATCIKVLVINFTVTTAGLQEQLLGEVVKNERPDLEKRKRQLVLSMSEDKKQLSLIEAKILRTLSTAEGNILDNKSLIATLGEAKTTSALIQKRVVDSEKAEQEINGARSNYVPVAARGSILYFVVASLATIDPMYQFSLDYFQRIFRICIEDAAQSAELKERLKNLIDYQTEVIYENICRGLFERHKTIFALIICMRIVMADNLVSDEEYDLFMKGPGVVNRDDQPQNPDSSFFSAVQWDFVCKLNENFSPFAGLANDLVDNLDAWKGWIEQKLPHKVSLPTKPFSDGKLTRMQVLLLIRAFCDDKVTFATKDFIGYSIGNKFTQAKAAVMEEVEADMDNRTPCVFILSAGSDPTNILLQYAKAKERLENLDIISLGQGQGPKARKLIENSLENGNWVLLQNCHLAKSWMPNLERIVSGIAESKKPASPDFRLFLTSMPVSYFPVTVLQNSLKMTNEAPEGMRNNMLRSYNQIVPGDGEDVPGHMNFETSAKSTAYKKLLFSLVYFHSIVQERRKFGALGWNIRYEFNDSDLETSISVLRLFLDGQDAIPWDAMNYVTGNINYGGRVTDDWDRRSLMCIMKKFYNESIVADDKQIFLSDTSDKYYIPPTGNLESYKEYIKTLPVTDEPGIFGMHSNAAITFQKKQTKLLLSTVLSIEAVGGSGGGSAVATDAMVEEMAITIAADLPEDLLQENAGRGVFKVDEETQLMSSLDTVLLQEMEKFNKLLHRIRSTLKGIQKAIKGESVMSLDLESMYNSFVINSVPLLWSNVAYPSLKPLASWIEDLQSRLRFMSSWLTKGEPLVFPLPALFFPQGFLTGVLQTHARKYLISINSLKFSFQVLTPSEISDVNAASSMVETKPSEKRTDSTFTGGESTSVDSANYEGNSIMEHDGVYVSGLWMEGLAWDEEKQMLQDCRKGEMFSLLPVIHFLPTDNVRYTCTTYKCPVYKISTRQGQLSTTGISTNFVTAIDLPTDKDEAFWIQRGAAALCCLDE